MRTSSLSTPVVLNSISHFLPIFSGQAAALVNPAKIRPRLSKMLKGVGDTQSSFFHLQFRHMAFDLLPNTPLPLARGALGRWLFGFVASVMAMVIVAARPAALLAQAEKASNPAGQAATSPPFGDNDALTILDNLKSALESYNRKKFLAQFDQTRMCDFPALRRQISSLFERYDSFNVTYHLMQTGTEKGEGIALADFGLDATSITDDMLDLRRHGQLRLVASWNGREWKIVDLNPRAVFK
ncbi:MAG: hypothetical protein JO249_18950 [Acidobacteria bacterium]|nr:hypothetical protein [Acidobacteriota bacterium]